MASKFREGIYSGLGQAQCLMLNTDSQRTPNHRYSPTPMTLSSPYNQEATGAYGINGFLEFILFTPLRKQEMREILIKERNLQILFDWEVQSQNWRSAS